MLDYYASRAVEYDATSYGAIAPADVADLKRLAAFVADLPPARTLDVACGTGFLTRLLGGDVVAVDQSSEMLAIAHNRIPGTRLVRAVVPPLPFAGDVFDRVFTSHFYGHIALQSQRRHVLDEAFRVADELIVIEQAWRPGLPDETWERRELRDGSVHRVFKRYFTAERLCTDLDGEIVHQTSSFVGVRARRRQPTSQ